ncbi:hypothetical protein [Daejeonella lutea]|uniref:Uncharacterized membrane protein n=1 Tax=Daejeonella lutea TaxID=572036 RepID=A0A1T5D1H9_9SPHI|nr:hypothetical protein [Daejeonella lutea]SKB65588.1 Uncharacterized membrane protein [Daejeonella lutea]
MKTYILIVVTAVILQSCSSPQQKVELTDTTTIVDSNTPADSVAVEKTNSPIVFKGLYTFGNEVRTFRDCSGNKTVYWVVDSSANLQARYEKTNRFPAYPYESVYAEVKGYLTGKSTMGYASEYENVLVVTDIIKVEPKNFKTECYNYEFIALGNEPFWSVDIIPDEKRIVFKNVGQEKALEFIHKPATVSAGVYRYEATSPGNKKIVVIIRKEKCSDGMSDREYNYSAEVIIDGTTFKGCAIKKGDQFNDQS